MAQLWHELTALIQTENEVVKTWGTPREEDGLRNHVDLVQMLDIADLQAGTTVAGAQSSRSQCELAR